jgi:predicted neuraminidase
MACLVFSAGAEQPSYESGFVFDPDAESHGHVHASCLIAAPNGDLRAAWYENGPELPPPYFGEQKDKSADVRIGGGRKAAGAAAWDRPFVMADTFGVSDNNPCMVVDREGRLWLFYGTLLAVPKVTWGSDLIQYRVSSDYAQPGPPKWEQSNLLVVQPASLEMDPTAVAPADDPKAAFSEKALEVRAKYVGKGPDNPFMSRLGWMPRAHPLLKLDGAILLPLANENSTLACMAFTKDGGQTWTYSNMVPGVGLEQPTVVEYADGAMSAFFRNGHPKNRILRSDSKDGGMTWGPVTLTELPHPGSGIEAVVLANGHLAMIYNDTEKDPRDRLAVSISEDRGATWRWTRHLENVPGQRFDYPSMIQTPDGFLHASYSYNLKTIKYARFNEAWVQQGD